MSDFLQSFLNYEASTEFKLAIFVLIMGLVIFKISDFKNG